MAEEEEVVRRKKKNEVFDCLTEEEIDKYNEAFTVRNALTFICPDWTI